MSSNAFGAKKRPAGKEFRDGTMGEALDDLYSDIEEGFVTAEAQSKQHRSFTVDYTDVSAVGAALVGPELPIGAVVTRAYYYVTTTFTSADDTATMSMGFLVDDVAGVLAAVAIDDGSNPFDTGPRECIQDGSMSTAAVLLSAARQLNIVTGVQALTAGSMQIHLEYDVIA